MESMITRGSSCETEQHNTVVRNRLQIMEGDSPENQNIAVIGNLTKEDWRAGVESLQTKESMEDLCCKINWNYVPIKAHYFFMYGGMGGALPYIQVVAKDYGLSSTAVGIIYTVVPLFVCLSKPLFGFIVDKIRNITVVLLLLLIVTALSFYAVLYIPPIKNYDSEISMQVTATCMEERNELIIDPPPYNSACAAELKNKQFKCNFTSDNCIGNSSLPGTLNISDALPLVKDIDTLSFTFKFKDAVPTLQDCDCFKHNSSSLVCESDISDCDSFKNVRVTSEYKLYNFWVFVLLALLSGAGSATCFCLSDAACYEVLSDNPRLFGRQRLWGTISWGIATLASGYLNDVFTGDSATTNYSPGFYLMLVLIGIDVLITCKLRLEKANMSSNICKDVGQIFSSWHTILFSLGVYISGAYAGLLWTYEFWFLTDLGARQLLLGLTAAVQCLIAEVPFFFFSGWFIKKFGHFYCLIVTLAAYSLRVGLYSILENPWMILPIDLLHGLTYAVFCAAMTLYAVDCAPPGTEATMLGILGGLFEGLGVATGSFLGGIGFDNKGGRWTFFVASMISLACVPFFAISYKIIQRSQGSLDFKLNSNIPETSKYGTNNLN